MRAAIERLGAPPARPAAPANPNVRLPEVTGFMLGRSDAPITMVEFTDLQCPFCSRFSTTTFEQIKTAYIDTGKVRFISRDLPLDFHPHAMPAAKASRCAGEQGRFWEMRQRLVASASTLSPDLMQATARDLALDLSAFDACVDSTRFDADIRADIQAAQSVGITGTPSFVIGRTSADGLAGVRVVGAQPFAAFEAHFQELLPD